MQRRTFVSALAMGALPALAANAPVLPEWWRAPPLVMDFLGRWGFVVQYQLVSLLNSEIQFVEVWYREGSPIEETINGNRLLNEEVMSDPRSHLATSMGIAGTMSCSSFFDLAMKQFASKYPDYKVDNILIYTNYSDGRPLTHIGELELDYT